MALITGQDWNWSILVKFVHENFKSPEEAMRILKWANNPVKLAIAVMIILTVGAILGAKAAKARIRSLLAESERSENTCLTK